MSATYNLSAKSAGNQTRIKDCFAAKFGGNAADYDDAAIAAKLDSYIQEIVNHEEFMANQKTHTNSDLT